jgi:hypothetical protein
VGKVGGPRGERLDEKGPIPDLGRVAWQGRQVTILFDANVHANTEVRKARFSLAKELRRPERGTRVLFVDIPAEAGVNGADDLVGTRGKERVLELLRSECYDPREQSGEPEIHHGYNWPDPLAAEGFYGLAGEIERTIEPHPESDPAALLVQFLVAFGNVVGRRAHFVAETDRHFTNLFTVIVGQTAKGRKGSSLGQIQFFFQGVDSAWSLERVTSGLSTGEGLIWTVRDPVYQSVAVKEKGRITGCEVVMVDAGENDKRLLVTEPEFARVLQVAERKENTLSAVLRQCWDTGDLHTLTRNQAARSTHAHISLILLGHKK